MINSNLVAEAIKKEFGSFFSTDAHKTNDIIRYINSAVRYIVTQYDFNFNKYIYTLVTNDVDTEYSIPYQIATYFVLNKFGDELDLLPFEEYFRLINKDNKVCILEDKLYTTIKSSELKIFYKGFPDIIHSLGDEIKIPEHFFDAVVLGATYYGFLDIKSYSNAGEKKVILEGLLKSLAKRGSDKLPLNIKRFNRGNSTIF